MQGSALSHWLVGVDVEQGPDGIDSPTFLKQNFDVLEAVQLYQEAQLGPLEELFDVNSPYPDGINQLALRISTYEYPLGALLAIYFLSVTGHMTPKFPLDHWIKAVQWHGDSKVAAVVNTMDEWVDAQKLLTPLVVVEAESTQGTVVWSSTQKDHPAISEGSRPLKLVVRPEHDIQRHLPHRTPSLGTFQLDRTKRGSRYMGPLSHLWKKQCSSITAVGALRPYESPWILGASLLCLGQCQTLGWGVVTCCANGQAPGCWSP